MDIKKAIEELNKHKEPIYITAKQAEALASSSGCASYELSFTVDGHCHLDWTGVTGVKIRYTVRDNR